MNRQAMKMGRICTNEEMMPMKPSIRSAETSTTLRPLVSAKQPQKYEPSTIPAEKGIIISFCSVKITNGIGHVVDIFKGVISETFYFIRS